MHDSQRKYIAGIGLLLGGNQLLIKQLSIMFGTLTYHGIPANRWKDDTYSGISKTESGAVR